jgi:NADPH:quinone reductase-like Zn-dependent oxidoreductase
MMRAAVLHQFGQSVKIEEVDRPSSGDDEVLLQTMACGIDGTDLKLCEGFGYTPDLPFVMGHEIAGVVHEVGRESPEHGVASAGGSRSATLRPWSWIDDSWHRATSWNSRHRAVSWVIRTGQYFDSRFGRIETGAVPAIVRAEQSANLGVSHTEQWMVFDQVIQHAPSGVDADAAYVRSGTRPGASVESFGPEGWQNEGRNRQQDTGNSGQGQTLSPRHDGSPSIACTTP